MSPTVDDLYISVLTETGIGQAVFGSSPFAKTIGIVVVAALAASAARVPLIAAITAT